MNKYILKFFIVTAIVFFASIFWYFYQTSQVKEVPPIEYSVDNTPTEVLETQNQYYAEAIAFEKAKKYDMALSSYQKALPEVQDKIQNSQIRLKIAIMNEWLGNYTEAITRLKEIAADADSYDIARAYAVQEIGFMNLYTENEIQQGISKETFKDLPYSSFKQDENYNMTYTRLFEYAANIYPLGYSLAYVAYGYSGEIINTLRRATTTSQGSEYVSRVQNSLKAADAGVARMKSIPGEAGLVPVALAWQGVAVSRLASVGVVDPQEAEPYFKEAIAYGDIIGDKPGNFNAFNYAAFLVYHYGIERKEDIKKLLLPFRINNESEIYPIMVSFYKNVRTDKKLAGDKKQVVFMSQVDEEFKAYLVSLGWEEADFKVTK